MHRIGTDVVALAAILGSGAVGGAVTLAMLDRSPQPTVAECVATSVVSAPRVVVASGRTGHSIVIAPSAHVRATGSCVDGVDAVVVSELAQADLERALAQLDESRVKLERLHGKQLDARLQKEMGRLQEELSRLGEETVR